MINLLFKFTVKKDVSVAKIKAKNAWHHGQEKMTKYNGRKGINIVFRP